MKLFIDTDHWELRVSRNPEPKLDTNGVQRTNKPTGDPLWSTQVFVLDESGGDVITVTTQGEMPDLKVGDLVEATRLEAIPWSSGGRTGVAFRADELYLVDPE